MERIPGFVFATVTNNEDPEGTGRVKVNIPALIEPETSYWVMPMCWPGAGGLGKGSQYPPPPRQAQVAVMFEFGVYDEPDSRAVYLTGYYGLTEQMTQAGPESLSAAPSASAAQKRVVLWEGAKLIAYIVEDDTEEKLVLQCKTSGSKVELNAKDGTGGLSETIAVEARTKLSLYAKGLLDIRADGVVQIQGRRVDALTLRGI